MPLRAQTAPTEPSPLVCETPDEVVARVHFERALRAWLEGKSLQARGEAQAGLEASPGGRFAPALRALLAKIEGPGLALPAAGTPGSARAEMIVVATIEGLLLGSLTAAGTNADAKGA